MPTNKSQSTVRDERGQEQHAEERAHHFTAAEEKTKAEAEVAKTAEKSGF